MPVNKLLPPSTPSIVFALPCDLELDIINSSPLPAGTVAGCVNTGPGRDTARHSRGETSLLVSCVISPHGCGCRSMSETQCHSPSRVLLGPQWEDSYGPAAVCHHPAGSFLHTSPSPWHPENSTGTPADGFLWARSSLTPQQTHRPEGCSHMLSSEASISAWGWGWFQVCSSLSFRGGSCPHICYSYIP